MQTLTIGDVSITSVIERDGPWRPPQDMSRYDFVRQQRPCHA